MALGTWEGERSVRERVREEEADAGADADVRQS
jgi:hypothetical protein